MAPVDDREGWRRLIASLAQWSRVIDGASEGMRTIEREGVIATVTPAAPERAVVNDVVYWDAPSLELFYDELEDAYRAAGIAAFTVWVPDSDTVTQERLAARGHQLDSDPEAMVLDLDRVQRPPAPPAYDAAADPLTIMRLNDAAYGLPGSFERALGGLRPREGMYLYAAGDGGDGPSSCLTAFDHGDDCSVWLVATLPEARGNGLATALMGNALADARERGRTSSTLEATDLGHRLYERLGYRSLGEIQMWERRLA